MLKHCEYIFLRMNSHKYKLETEYFYILGVYSASVLSRRAGYQNSCFTLPKRGLLFLNDMPVCCFFGYYSIFIVALLLKRFSFSVFTCVLTICILCFFVQFSLVPLPILIGPFPSQWVSLYFKSVSMMLDFLITSLFEILT